MKTAKNAKAGETCILSKYKTDNPKLCAKKMSDGRMSLYLLYYLGYKKTVDPVTGKVSIRTMRRKESLNLYLYCNPRTPDERRHNAQVSEIALTKRFEKERERRLGEPGYRPPADANIDFLQYFREYIDNYTKKDKDVLQISYRRFTDFLTQTPKYQILSTGIKPSRINRDMIAEFADYLRSRSRGEGANTIYERFKKVVRHATEHDVFRKNPCAGITIKADKSLVKDILSIDEMKILINTPYRDDNLRRAFLFCCYTGLRFCDVSELTFGNVDFSNRLLRFNQRKTEGHSAHSRVTIPLNDNTLHLIGPRGDPDEKIFSLYCYHSCNRSLQKWIRRAGIEKHITWHCARHSFAVNVLSNGANIKTVSNLLGHSSISITEKYLHVIDSQKRAAVDSLPNLM
ncbi:MAG: site-specific integrase [Bacteroidales bacterium]|nr:site-specific integrase [Bacteroidales bacterium]